MKKVLFSLFAVGFFATALISCQSNQKGKVESATDTAATAKKDTSSATTPSILTKTGNENLDVEPDEKVKVPQFSSEEVNAAFAKFEPLRQKYSDAIKDNNAGQIKELTAQYNKWVNEASLLSSKLPANENQLCIDTYTKFVTQWDKLSAQKK